MIKRLYWLMPLFLVATDAIARGRAGGYKAHPWWEPFLLMLVVFVVFFLPFILILVIVAYRRKIAAGFASMMRRVRGRLLQR